jgi:2-oxoglutarate ferredoxin oxidoreductase subunit delta
MPQVKVLSERCKGCGLCVLACPKHNLALGKDYNAQGYAYVTFDPDGKCTGCTFCAELCPDMALRVYKEEKA